MVPTRAKERNSGETLCRFEESKIVGTKPKLSLQARNISSLLTDCGASVESACSFSFPDMTDINVRMNQARTAVQFQKKKHFYRNAERNASYTSEIQKNVNGRIP